MQTMEQKVTRGKEIKDALYRVKEIKIRLALLDRESRALAETTKKPSALASHWVNSIEYHRQQFVSELASRCTDGRIPHIKFDSPEAIAFINAEVWLSVIPSLAERCSGVSADNGNASRLADISAETLQLKQELLALGNS